MLARYLVGVELGVIEQVAANRNGNLPLPEWLDGSGAIRCSQTEQFLWEPHGGIRRMKWKLATIEKSIKGDKS